MKIEEGWCAINQMTMGKASRLSGVVIEIFKAGRGKCLKSLTNVFNDILFRDKLLKEWMLGSFKR